MILQPIRHFGERHDVIDIEPIKRDITLPRHQFAGLQIGHMRLIPAPKNKVGRLIRGRVAQAEGPVEHDALHRDGPLGVA